MMTETTFKFAKMHGLGNDFVVIDNITQKLEWNSLPITEITDRQLGIGCDQILLIESSEIADFFCKIINSDGTEAEQCGNGLRCVARYVVENQLHSNNQLTIATSAGIFPVEITDFDNIRISLNISDLSQTKIDLTLPEQSQTITGDALSIGNPHFIINVYETNDQLTTGIGEMIATHKQFPNGVNVGFVETVSNKHIRLRTFERGSGLTNACGSNACAAVAAGVLNGSLDNCVDVEFKYGKLKIEWHGKGQPILMTGPASMVFTGEYIVR